MDSFLLYSLLCTAIYVSLSVIYFIKKANTSKGKLPPGSTGWPVVGENLSLAVSGPEKYISDRIKKYSPEVFKTSILGEKMVVLCGAAGNKFLFNNENKILTTWWPKSFIKPLLCSIDMEKTVKMIALLNRNFITETLRPEYLKRHIPVMDSLAKNHIAKEWEPLKQVKVYDLVKKYVFGQVCKLFLGIEDQDEVNKLSAPFIDVTTAMFSVPVDFPGTSYHRAIKNGRLVHSMIHKIIERRRKEMAASAMDEHRDMLARLISFTDEDGQNPANSEISNYIMAILIAAYDTTSAAITFMLKNLAMYPHVYAEVYKEQMEIVKCKSPNERLSWDDVQKMKYTWNVGCETLRLFPPAQGTFRETVTDFSYAGFTIPKGWKTFWSPYTTHKNPKYFPEPEKFDPTRFEGNGPEPYTFAPFAGGPRMCPGKEYGRLAILVFVHNIVTKFKLELLMPHEKIDYHASPMPANGLPVKLIPHQN